MQWNKEQGTFDTHSCAHPWPLIYMVQHATGFILQFESN
jgi:hypothetical protein